MMSSIEFLALIVLPAARLRFWCCEDLLPPHTFLFTLQQCNAWTRAQRWRYSTWEVFFLGFFFFRWGKWRSRDRGYIVENKQEAARMTGSPDSLQSLRRILFQVAYLIPVMSWFYFVLQWYSESEIMQTYYQFQQPFIDCFQRWL